MKERPSCGNKNENRNKHKTLFGDGGQGRWTGFMIPIRVDFVSPTNPRRPASLELAAEIS